MRASENVDLSINHTQITKTVGAVTGNQARTCLHLTTALQLTWCPPSRQNSRQSLKTQQQLLENLSNQASAPDKPPNDEANLRIKVWYNTSVQRAQPAALF